MRSVRFLGFAHTRTYASATQPAWEPGEVREVEEAEAARLIEDFGPAFELVAPKPARAVVSGTKKAATRKRATRKRTTAKK